MDLFLRDVRVIFPRLPLASLAGGLLLLTGSLAAQPAAAQTTISSGNQPGYEANSSGSPYTIEDGATFNGSGMNGFVADSGVTVNVQGGQFGNNDYNGLENDGGTINVTGGEFGSATIGGNHGEGFYINGGSATIAQDTSSDTPSFSSNDDGVLDIGSSLGITAGQFNHNATTGLQVNSGTLTINANTVSGGTDPQFNNNGSNGLVIGDGTNKVTATITAGQFDGNINSGGGDGVYVASGSTLNVNTDATGVSASFEQNSIGLQVDGTATINAGQFGASGAGNNNGLQADNGGNVTIYDGAFDDNSYGLYATDSNTVIDLYGGTFSGDTNDLGADSSSTIYIYGSNLGFSMTSGGTVDYTDTTNPYNTGYVDGTLADGQTVSLSYNTNGGSIVLEPNASAAPEPSQMAVFGFVGLGLGGMMLRARRRTAQNPA